MCLLVLGLAVMGIITLTPLVVLERLEKDLKMKRQVVGLSALLHRSQELGQHVLAASTAKEGDTPNNHATSDTRTDTKPRINWERGQKHGKQQPKREKQQQQRTSVQQDYLGRGVSGLPWEETPALVGAKRGHIQCDMNVDDLAYWNDPQGQRDINFKGYYYEDNPSNNRYLTFEPDCGGWNNIRMSVENIFVLAAATGRTLVLPPNTPFYLLGDGKQNARSFASFYNLDKLREKISVMSMKEFVTKEGERLLGLSPPEQEKLMPVADTCLHQPKSNSDVSCGWLTDVLRTKGVQPEMEAAKHCLAFSDKVFDGGTLTTEEQVRVNQFCGVRSIDMLCVCVCFCLCVETCLTFFPSYKQESHVSLVQS